MTERLWFKIGAAADRLGVSPKELRYWELVIPELKPRRSKGNLRYYHLDEFPRLERIRDWIRQGLTVADCRELLLHGQLTRGLALDLDDAPPPRPASGRGSKLQPPAPTAASRPKPQLTALVKALHTLIAQLSKPPRTPAKSKPRVDRTPTQE